MGDEECEGRAPGLGETRRVEEDGFRTEGHSDVGRTHAYCTSSHGKVFRGTACKNRVLSQNGKDLKKENIPTMFMHVDISINLVSTRHCEL